MDVRAPSVIKRHPPIHPHDFLPLGGATAHTNPPGTANNLSKLAASRAGGGPSKARLVVPHPKRRAPRAACRELLTVMQIIPTTLVIMHFVFRLHFVLKLWLKRPSLRTRCWLKNLSVWLNVGLFSDRILGKNTRPETATR